MLLRTRSRLECATCPTSQSGASSPPSAAATGESARSPRREGASVSEVMSRSASGYAARKGRGSRIHTVSTSQSSRCTPMASSDRMSTPLCRPI